MRARVETGTDIAMLGAWDAARNASPLAKLWGKEFNQALEADACSGHLFLIETGADCGGPIDVLAEEEIPAELRPQMTRLPGEFLLRAPSGKLVIGGVEDYRSGKPKITDERSVVEIPAGDYLVRAHVGPEENMPVTPNRAELEALLGADDFRYFKRVERQGCLGYLTLLLFPALAPFLGWKMAAGLAVLAVIGFFYIRERVFLRRDQRYNRINHCVNEAYVRASAKSTPIFLFELQKLADIAGRQGGSINMRDVHPNKA